MKYTADRPLADPEKAARKLLEIASTVEPIQDGRIHIEKINGWVTSSRLRHSTPNLPNRVHPLAQNASSRTWSGVPLG